MSWVLLTDDRAYKLKKPVHFDFLDLREPAARRRACEAEVTVNQALAGDIVLGVRGVVADGDGFVLAGREAASAAVDWVVEMRRFDEAATMASAVRREDLRHASVVATARTIQRFHAGAARPSVPAWAQRVGDAWNENIDELEAAAGAALAPQRLDAARGFAAGFLRRRGGELDERARRGCVVDGHGDLRAEHVVLGDDGLAIVDRLEFDPWLRRVDVADDLAFLVMDLHALGAGRAAAELVSAYRDAGGDAGDDGLVAAFAVYRAQVRAKVGYLRAAQLRGDGAADAHGAAERLVAVAERLAWAARGPTLLVVAGPPASGKSTLASALAHAGDIPLLSSDRVRRSSLAVPVGAHAPGTAYAPEARRQVYEALGERASTALRSGSVVVDATFGEPGQRDAFLAGLSRADRDRTRVVVCEAPLDVRIARARARAAAGDDPSDAGPDVVRRLAGSTVWSPSAHRLEISTAGSADDLPDRVAAWLDATP